MKYEFLLFDADNTILDFDKSEEQALRIAFGKANLPFDQGVLEVYRRNNIFQWQLFEQGKLTKQEVLINRFVGTFADLGIVADIDNVANDYEHYLKQGFFVVDHAREVLTTLQQTHKLYLVSNGVAEIQKSRLAGSDMGKYFLARFVSEEVGYPKPRVEYFDYCFSRIPNFDKSKALIIGDSVTSDIQGGINAGIDTCWFNYHKSATLPTITSDYVIDDLRQLLNIVL